MHKPKVVFTSRAKSGTITWSYDFKSEEFRLHEGKKLITKIDFINLFEVLTEVATKHKLANRRPHNGTTRRAILLTAIPALAHIYGLGTTVAYPKSK